MHWKLSIFGCHNRDLVTLVDRAATLPEETFRTEINVLSLRIPRNMTARKTFLAYLLKRFAFSMRKLEHVVVSGLQPFFVALMDNMNIGPAVKSYAVPRKRLDWTVG